ncbi:histone-lysine N-methyltransferase MECOM-like isoform X2 [Anneissia japonica]|uniref:histone-lysine N-methyltransferase MECOM-like isoform X2 n=1 Tax=Anneissia japonica TaxID=1529436 RepID=UPI0014258D4C|nr:histone-lysine N-methyltransferase MECOM-like isoform X2 [Anneissia japonica]
MYSSEQTSDNDTSSSTGEDTQETTDNLSQEYIPEKITVPPRFELRESSLGNTGLGVFSLADVPIGEKFGPFKGVERRTITNSEFACKSN